VSPIEFTASWDLSTVKDGETLSNYDVKFYLNDTNHATTNAVDVIDAGAASADVYSVDISQFSGANLVGGKKYSVWALITPANVSAGKDATSSPMGHITVGVAPQIEEQSDFRIVPGETSVTFFFDDMTLANRGYKDIVKVQLVLSEVAGGSGATSKVLDFTGAGAIAKNGNTLSVVVQDDDTNGWDIPAGVWCDATATLFNNAIASLAFSAPRAASFVYRAAPAAPNNLDLDIIGLQSGEMKFTFDRVDITNDPVSDGFQTKLDNGAWTDGLWDSNGEGERTFSDLVNGQTYTATVRAYRNYTADELAADNSLVAGGRKYSSEVSETKQYFNLSAGNITFEATTSDATGDFADALKYTMPAQASYNDVTVDTLDLTLKADPNMILADQNRANNQLATVTTEGWTWNAVSKELTKTITAPDADEGSTPLPLAELTNGDGLFLDYVLSGVASATFDDGDESGTFDIAADDLSFTPLGDLPAVTVLALDNMDGDAPLSTYASGWDGVLNVQFSRLTNLRQGNGYITYDVMLGSTVHEADIAQGTDEYDEDLNGFVVGNSQDISIKAYYRKGESDERSSESAAQSETPIGKPRAVSSLSLTSNGLNQITATFAASPDYESESGAPITAYRISVEDTEGHFGSVQVKTRALDANGELTGYTTATQNSVLINPSASQVGTGTSPWVVQQANGKFIAQLAISPYDNPGSSMTVKVETIYAESASDYAFRTSDVHMSDKPVIVSTTFSSAADGARTVSVNNKGAALREVLAVGIPAALDEAALPVLQLAGSALPSGSEATDAVAYDLVFTFKDANNADYTGALAQIFLVIESASGLAYKVLG
jgi:hypothetical protein